MDAIAVPHRRATFPDPAARTSGRGKGRGEGPGKPRLGLLALGLTVAIFAVDALTSLEGAVAVLYVVVVLLSARACGRRGIVQTGASCMLLTAAAYVIAHGIEHHASPMLRCLVSLVAVAVATALEVQNQRTTAALAEQAGLLDLTHDAIFVRDARDVITFWNRAAEELYGWSQAEALGKVSHALLRTGFPAGREAAMAELLRTGRWEGELVHSKRSGETVAVESSWALRRDAGGGPEAILETNADITARKAAHAAHLAAQAELAHAARKATLGELTASIAHEVNQPLAAVVTNGQAALRWLSRDVPDIDEASQALSRLVASGERAGAIVARIRTFLTKAPPRHERVALDAVIGEAASLVEREMSLNGVVLRRDIAADLPPVLGDRVQLQQVVINLMINGIQAMAAVEGRPRLLSVRARRRSDGTALVEIADRGVGIAPQVRDRLFTPFVTTKADGMGLGLSICRSTVEAHGGRIRAADADGPGAVFRFTLPAADGRSS